MPGKKNQVVLGETTYNFSILPDRIWFEDDISKCQWEWKNEESPEPKPTFFEVPLNVFLENAKRACENGDGRARDCMVTVKAVESTGDLSLLVPLTPIMSHWTRPAFQLKLVPLSREQLMKAQFADLREQIQELKQHVARLQEEADKPWRQKLWEWVRCILINYGERVAAASKYLASMAWELFWKAILVVDEWMMATEKQPARPAACSLQK